VFFLDFLLGHDIDSNYGSAAWEAADMYTDRATYVVALACFVHDPPAHIRRKCSEQGPPRIAAYIKTTGTIPSLILPFLSCEIHECGPWMNSIPTSFVPSLRGTN